MAQVTVERRGQGQAVACQRAFTVWVVSVSISCVLAGGVEQVGKCAGIQNCCERDLGKQSDAVPYLSEEGGAGHVVTEQGQAKPPAAWVL